MQPQVPTAVGAGGPVRPLQSPLSPKRHGVLRPGRRSCSVFPQWDRAPRRTRARDPGEGTRVGGGQSQGTHPSPRGSSEPHRIAGRGVVAQLAWLLAQAPPLHTLAFLPGPGDLGSLRAGPSQAAPPLCSAVASLQPFPAWLLSRCHQLLRPQAGVLAWSFASSLLGRALKSS